MLKKIAAWIRNPACEFREQTWNQKRTNLEFLKGKYGQWFIDLPRGEQEKMADSFMNLQRTRLWVWRNIGAVILGIIALLFWPR